MPYGECVRINKDNNINNLTIAKSLKISDNPVSIENC